MILVTGAGGKTGRAVLQALSVRGAAARGLVRTAGQSAALAELGAVPMIADMRSPEDVRRAMNGAAAVYHIPPNVHPDEVELGRITIAAALEAGVERFVYHSVLRPGIEAMPHHWRKMRVEEQLFASGLPFTVLQPAPYFQNVLPYLPRMRAEGVYAVPYSVDAPLAHVDLADLAEAAALVLTGEGHKHAVYEICAEAGLTAREIARIVGEAGARGTAFSGRGIDETHGAVPFREGDPAISAVSVAIEAWAEAARSGGLGDYAVETLSAMFRYYDAHGLPGNAGALAGLLGRRPRTFVEFLDHRGSGRNSPARSLS